MKAISYIAAMHLYPACFLHPVKFLMACSKPFRCPRSAMVKATYLCNETVLQNNFYDTNRIF